MHARANAGASDPAPTARPRPSSAPSGPRNPQHAPDTSAARASGYSRRAPPVSFEPFLHGALRIATLTPDANRTELPGSSSPPNRLRIRRQHFGQRLPGVVPLDHGTSSYGYSSQRQSTTSIFGLPM